MFRPVGRTVVAGASCSSLLSREQRRQSSRAYFDVERSGRIDLEPRAEQDIKLTDPDNQVLPGTHPLPLTNEFMERSGWPLVSPYLPSPQRPHPYWKEAPSELPCLDATTPGLYGRNTMRDPIYVPVFNLEGQITHCRRMDPALFGYYPTSDLLAKCHVHWVVRMQNYRDQWDFQRLEIYRKHKKNWPNTGTGMGRVSDRKWALYPWGARTAPHSKPWNKIMPDIDNVKWQMGNRMMLTLKLLQGKVQIVDELSLPNPTGEAFEALCERMKWDVRHDGAGVMFMDGGSRLAPSLEFNSMFFYGSFYNGRCKVVRPTILKDTSIDWNRESSVDPHYFGPRGVKNPIPINRFNVHDAMDHHLIVLTEGALAQLEQELYPITVEGLPPHIRQQLPLVGALGSHHFGDEKQPIETIEYEAFGRTEELEKPMYEPYYDNPYRPWQDEDRASYEVDPVDGYIKRHVRPVDEKTGKVGQENAVPGGWRVLE